MSDLILQEKGTIDKYIGDAIVSFFGAPTDLPDHAYRACLAAIRMKQAEAELNKQLYDAGDIPMSIFTRIGINTGEMVVGNMGTEKKMNYTIMGNDVNLAARLEGVNKKYGTWILASESTWSSGPPPRQGKGDGPEVAAGVPALALAVHRVPQPNAVDDDPRPARLRPRPHVKEIAPI